MLFLHQSEDVLSIIFNLCSKSSLLSLFVTSSHLHSLLAPFILRDVHLTRDHHQISSFLQYIIAHRRIPFIGSHVKSLNIAYTAIVPSMEEGEELESSSQNPSSWASLLSSALSLMPNLRALILGYQVDKIFASYPDIPDRILRLKYLSCIQLSDIDTAAADTLHLRSLRNIKVVLKRHMKLVPVSSQNGVGKILIQNRNTLSKLSLANPDFSAANFLDSPSAVFPNVTTLSLTSYTASPLELSRSFPNVRLLTLTGSSTFFSSPTTPNSPPGESKDEILFPHVSSLHSDEPDLRALLSPPFIPTPTPSLSLSNLRHLSLNSISLTKYSSSWFLKGANLSGLQSFKFCIWNAAPSESWWREFVQGVPNLEFLDATIRVDVTFRDLMLIDIKLAQLLSPLPLKYISLRTLRPDSPGQCPPLRDDQVAEMCEAYIKTLHGMRIAGWQSVSGESFWIKNSILGIMAPGVSAMDRDEGRRMRERLDSGASK